MITMQKPTLLPKDRKTFKYVLMGNVWVKVFRNNTPYLNNCK